MFFQSFRYAVSGISHAIKSGRNFRVMIVCFLIVVLSGFLFTLTTLEWIAVLLCSGGALSLEMVNTAIENALDLVTKQHLPLAKIAKDVAAGASLVWSIFSAAIGLLIFLPRLIALF